MTAGMFHVKHARGHAPRGGSRSGAEYRVGAAPVSEYAGSDSLPGHNGDHGRQ